MSLAMLVKDCGPVSCLISMKPFEVLRLQHGELIASESVDTTTEMKKSQRNKLSRSY